MIPAGPGRRRSKASREALCVGLLAAAFLFRGLLLNAALPYGDPLDEPFHYGYASYLASAGHPPRAQALTLALEALRPWTYLPHADNPGSPRLSWKEFASLEPSQRERRFRSAFEADAAAREGFVTTNYEAQQPPLAYVPAAVVLRFFRSWTLDRRLFALRALATILGACAVPLAHAFFRQVLSRRGALAATAAWTAFPGVALFVGRFSNDALALLIAAAMLPILARAAGGRLTRSAAAGFAALLALGCWTKLYFLPLLPALPLACLFAPARVRRAAVLRAAVASAAALVLFLPWAVRQRADTGDWLGTTPTKQALAARLELADRVAAVPDLLTARHAVIFARTLLWPGTWSAMGAPARVAVGLTACFFSLAILPNIGRNGRSRRRRAVSRGASTALLLFLAGAFVYADAFMAVARARGHPIFGGTAGWYVLVLSPLFLVGGCLAGRSISPRLLWAAALVFLLSDWILTMGVLPAVYAGWTEPNGSNGPWRIWMLMAGSPLVSLETYRRVGLIRPSLVLLVPLLSGASLCQLCSFLLDRPADRRLRAS